MNSSIFIVPIVGVAAYFIYRHLKRETTDGGSGTCSDCPSRGKCGAHTPGNSTDYFPKTKK